MNYIGIYSGMAVKCFILGKAKMREYNDEKEGGSWRASLIIVTVMYR